MNDKTLEDIVNYLPVFIDYINNFVPYSRERDNAISKLEESVFWITYLNDSGD